MSKSRASPAARGARAARSPSSRRRRGGARARAGGRASRPRRHRLEDERADERRRRTPSGVEPRAERLEEDGDAVPAERAPGSRRRGPRVRERPVVGDLGARRPRSTASSLARDAVRREGATKRRCRVGELQQRPVAVDGDGVEVSETHPDGASSRAASRPSPIFGPGEIRAASTIAKCPARTAAQLARLRSLRSLGERRAAVRRGQVPVRVELCELRPTPTWSTSPATFAARASRSRSPASDCSVDV